MIDLPMILVLLCLLIISNGVLDSIFQRRIIKRLDSIEVLLQRIISRQGS